MSSPVFPQIPALSAGLTFVNADGTTAKTLYTAPAQPTGNGVMIGRIRATSEDTVAVTLQFIKTISGVDYVLGETQVPIGAGTNGSTAWKDVMADINQGLPITLAPSDILKVKPKAAVTLSGAPKVYVTMEGAPL